MTWTQALVGRTPDDPRRMTPEEMERHRLRSGEVTMPALLAGYLRAGQVATSVLIPSARGRKYFHGERTHVLRLLLHSTSDVTVSLRCHTSQVFDVRWRDMQSEVFAASVLRVVERFDEHGQLEAYRRGVLPIGHRLFAIGTIPDRIHSIFERLSRLDRVMWRGPASGILWDLAAITHRLGPHEQQRVFDGMLADQMEAL